MSSPSLLRQSLKNSFELQIPTGSCRCHAVQTGTYRYLLIYAVKTIICRHHAVHTGTSVFMQSEQIPADTYIFMQSKNDTTMLDCFRKPMDLPDRPVFPQVPVFEAGRLRTLISTHRCPSPPDSSFHIRTILAKQSIVPSYSVPKRQGPAGLHKTEPDFR
jgi:hypothetical protein